MGLTRWNTWSFFSNITHTLNKYLQIRLPNCKISHRNSLFIYLSTLSVLTMTITHNKTTTDENFITSWIACKSKMAHHKMQKHFVRITYIYIMTKKCSAKTMKNMVENILLWELCVGASSGLLPHDFNCVCGFLV